MKIVKKIRNNDYLKTHWKEFLNSEKRTFTKDLAWNKYDFMHCPDDSTVVVEIRDSEFLVAYGIMYIRPRHGDYYIANVAVIPEYQSQHLGRVIMNSLIGLSEKKRISLYTVNPIMIHLCESLGFKKIKKIRNYANSQDAMLMRLDSIR